jgi:hypothetical protein
MDSLADLEGEDIFDNLNANDISETYSVTSIISTVWFVTSELIKLLISCCSAATSVFLICTISKFDSLRRSNHIFILHYAIGCLVDMLLLPLLVFVREVIALKGPILWEVICLLYTLTSSTCLLVFVFGASIGIYWFIESVTKARIQIFARSRIYFIVALYVICIIKLIILFTECFSDTELTATVIVVVYSILLLTLIIMNIAVRRFELNEGQRKTKFLLTISTYIVCSYLPILALSIAKSFYLPDLVNDTVGYAYFFAECFAYSGIIVVAYLLRKKNKRFKTAYNKVCKSSAARDDENMFDDESEVGG